MVGRIKYGKDSFEELKEWMEEKEGGGSENNN